MFFDGCSGGFIACGCLVLHCFVVICTVFISFSTFASSDFCLVGLFVLMCPSSPRTLRHWNTRGWAGGVAMEFPLERPGTQQDRPPTNARQTRNRGKGPLQSRTLCDGFEGGGHGSGAGVAVPPAHPPPTPGPPPAHPPPTPRHRSAKAQQNRGRYVRCTAGAAGAHSHCKGSGALPQCAACGGTWTSTDVILRSFEPCSRVDLWIGLLPPHWVWLKPRRSGRRSRPTGVSQATRTTRPASVGGGPPLLFGHV